MAKNFSSSRNPTPPACRPLPCRAGLPGGFGQQTVPLRTGECRARRENRPIVAKATGAHSEKQQQQQQRTFKADFLDCLTLSPQQVTSWRFAAVCAGSAALSLAAFALIDQRIVAQAIQHGYGGPARELRFFDLHYGYSAAEARALLGAWGAAGRQLYLLAEGIDCTLYHAGYRGMWQVLIWSLMTFRILCRCCIVATRPSLADDDTSASS